MTENQIWQIFKNTGSVEAYITFSQMKEKTETVNGVDFKDKRDNIENEGYSG